MKNPITRLTLGLLGLSMTTIGWADNTFSDTAEVVSVDPIYKTVTISRPERHCWREPVTRHRPGRAHRSYTAPILGGILGGAVGNRFGGGDGRDVMTVAGALLGASIGNDLNHRPPPVSHTRMEERCEMVEGPLEEREQQVGYRVKYRYNGKTFVTRMDHDPGDEMGVTVSLRTHD